LPGKRLLVYAGLGVSACLFLTVLLAGAFWLSNRNGRATGPTSMAGAQVGMTEDTTTASVTAGSSIATASPQEETPTSPSVTAATQVVEESTSHQLLIVTRGDDSLFLVNQGTEPLLLGLLRLGDGKGAINGADWGIDTLGNGDCVAVWKESGKPKSPAGLTCNEMGEHLTRDGPDRFWKEVFNVYYREEKIGDCAAKSCSIKWYQDDGD
jgi:hypothetical protein